MHYYFKYCSINIIIGVLVSVVYAYNFSIIPVNCDVRSDFKYIQSIIASFFTLHFLRCNMFLNNEMSPLWINCTPNWLYSMMQYTFPAIQKWCTRARITNRNWQVNNYVIKCFFWHKHTANRRMIWSCMHIVVYLPVAVGYHVIMRAFPCVGKAERCIILMGHCKLACLSTHWLTQKFYY